MAAISFPQNPTLNQEFTPVGGLVTYKWNGTFWQLATAGIASSASFANSARSASFATRAITASITVSSSFSLTSITASFARTSSFAVRSISSSFASTASLLTGTASHAVSSSYAETALTASKVETSSFSFTASFLTSTASDAVSASYALTASNVQTSSFAFSSSLTRTASYALTASNVQTSSFSLTSSLARTASFLAGTASRAITSSYALTASKVETSSFAFTASLLTGTASWAINALNGGSVVVVSASVPQTNSISGTLWWNSENGNLYIQTQGPTGSQWAPANATIGTSVTSDTSSYAFTASYIEVAPLALTASYFSGSGAEIYDIPAASIVGLNLAAISSGSATASFNVNGVNRSLQINTNTAITGTLTTTRIIADTASFVFSTTVFETSSISFVTGSTKFGSLLTNTHEFTGSFGITGSSVLKGNTTISGSVEITGSLTSKGNFVVTGSTNTVGNTTTVGSFVLSGSLNLHQPALVSGTNMFGTASWANQAISASFSSTSSLARTASFISTLSQSVTISGTLGVFTGTGTELEVLSTGVNIGNAIADTHRITGSVGITGSLQVVGGGITGSLLGTASFAPTNITYGEAILPSIDSIFNVVDVVSIPLPSAGTWKITRFVRATAAAANTILLTFLADSANTAVANSRLLGSFGYAGLQTNGTMVDFITTTGAATYKLRAFAINSIGGIASDTNGISKVIWEKIK